LRWFWWRINIYTELAGMIISLVVAIVFNELNLGWDPNIELVASVGITTVGWLIVTFITKPTSNETLKDFYTKIQPGGPGWKRIRKELGIVGKDKASVALPYQILAMVVGSVFVYSALFASGSFIYGRMQTAWLLTGVLVISGFVLFKLWKKISLSN
jgi:solute:Na+ symporter, SSS family